MHLLMIMKNKLKDMKLQKNYKYLKKPIIYVNQIGGQDELVFDGGSFVLDGSGKIISNLKIWTEDVKV